RADRRGVRPAAALATKPHLTVGQGVSEIPKLVTRGLGKTYAAGRRRSVPALEGVDVSVDAGSFVSIVGASGCGKSTLLNIVGGLEPATEGVGAIAGRDRVGAGAH